MSETRAATVCACCRAGLVVGPEFAFCPACGFIATDPAEAVDHIEALRQRLASSTTGEINLDVPNALATLTEGAWWELCGGRGAHFTAGSLTRFVRMLGLGVTTLSVTVDGRRALLKATRAAAPARLSFDLEDDLTAVAMAVEAFPSAMERQVARWRRVIGELLNDGQRVAICGAEPIAKAFLSRLQIDQTRLVQVMDASCPPDVVIALVDAAADVRRRLQELGLRPLVLTP